jgi:hypothetical protein
MAALITPHSTGEREGSPSGNMRMPVNDGRPKLPDQDKLPVSSIAQESAEAADITNKIQNSKHGTFASSRITHPGIESED